MKKYSVILADPPWSYRDIGMDWAAKEGTKYRRSVMNHYGVMTIEDICALPIQDFMEENCALFLWTTWPHIFFAQDVMNAWGFRYRSLAWVWAKLNKSSMGFHYGMGWYTRGNSEPCLLAIKGSMPPAVRDVQSLIVSSIREHSRKPDEQYGKIERLYPDAPKLELFARRPWDGWDAWGNEVDSDIAMQAEEIES